MSATTRTVAAALACGIALTTGLVVGRRTAPAPVAAEKADKDEKEAAEKGDHREVTLTEEGLAAARIQVAKVKKQALARELGLTGQVEFHPDRVASVGAKIAARITRVHAGIGDVVTANQPLAVIDSMELARARGAYLAATARRVAAQAAFTRSEALHADGVVPTKQVEETKSDLAVANADVAAARGTLVALGLSEADAGSATSLVTLRSPIAGRVVRRDAVIGQSLEASATIFTIADLSEVWVQLEVFERDFARVPVGATVNITTTAHAGRVFAGKISFVSEVLDDKTRTVRARVVLANGDGALRPGMFVRATLADSKGAEASDAEPALVVPVSAIQRIGDDDYVFVRIEPRKFQARAVALGDRSGGLVEVRRGLREGDDVVTEGALTLKAELERASFGDDD